MDSIKEYLLSVTAAAIVCSCIAVLFSKKGTASTLIKLLCGVFLSLAVLKPVVNISLPDLASLGGFASDDAQAAIAAGQLMAAEAEAAIIKEQAEAYIQDKASDLECEVDVTVILSKEAPYIPCEVEIRGAVSPYAKAQLSAWIEDTFDIPGEDQKWTG